MFKSFVSDYTYCLEHLDTLPLPSSSEILRELEGLAFIHSLKLGLGSPLRAFILLLTHTNVYILKAWYDFGLPVLKLYAPLCNSPFWDTSMLMHMYLLVFTLLFKKKHPWYQTWVSCIGRRILNPWTTREVPPPCIHFSCCTEFHGMDLRHFVLSTVWQQA